MFHRLVERAPALLERALYWTPAVASLVASGYLGSRFGALAHHLLQTGNTSDLPSAISGTVACLVLAGYVIRNSDAAEKRREEQNKTDRADLIARADLEKAERAAWAASAAASEERVLKVVENSTAAIREVLDRRDGKPLTGRKDENSDRRRQPG